MGNWNSNAERANLHSRRGIEFDGSTDGRCGRIFVDAESERQMAVGGKIQRVRRDLCAAVIANHYRNIHRLRRNAIERHAGRRSCRIVESQHVAASATALERHHRLLAIGVVAKNHKPAHACTGGELRRAHRGSRVRRRRGTLHDQRGPGR